MSSVVYFIQAGTEGPIKIGLTAGNPVLRLNKIQSDCPFKVHLLGVLDGDHVLERELHRKFAPLRQKGEWFAPHRDLLAWIAENVVPIAARASGKAIDPTWHPLRKFRARTGMTLRELADHIGISHASLSRFETGTRKPEIDTVVKLVKFTGISARCFRPDIAPLFDLPVLPEEPPEPAPEKPVAARPVLRVIE